MKKVYGMHEKVQLRPWLKQAKNLKNVFIYV
jgi:hypothetical protein